MLNESNFTERDRRQLLGFNPSGYADGLFERNWCTRMGDLGLLKYVSGDCSGGRTYDITTAGLEAIKPLLFRAFDAAI